MTTSRPVRTEDDVRRLMRQSRWVLRLSRNWLWIVLGFLFVYTGLSLTAPVLMKAGAEGPANVIYTIYKPMCHQFAFRSWFFFGEQVAYPREIAGADIGSFEEYAAKDPEFAGLDLSVWTSDLQLKARSFTGNETMGYKSALCQRDVLIYGVMFVAGLLFIPIRKRLRPAPVLLYLFLGLGPIALDGGSQLVSYPPLELWPVRETLPGYRALTGAMFGLMNVWLAFPYLEQSMNEAQAAMTERLAIADERLALLRGESGEG